jgi:phage host-nuclease inhibitor protein Gam
MAKTVKAPAIPVPQTREQFEALAVELATTMREIARINSNAADRVARVKLDAKEATAALGKREDVLWLALQAYAGAHRSELLTADRKSVAIAAGTIGWRLGKAKIVTTGGAEPDDVVAWLVDQESDQFLRIKTELDKEALLAAPDQVEKIPGIAIFQGDEFFFKPLDLDEEKVKRAPAPKAA